MTITGAVVPLPSAAFGGLGLIGVLAGAGCVQRRLSESIK
jgi:hypothetical protein